MTGKSVVDTRQPGHSTLDPVDAQGQKAGVKPAQFLLLALLCCSCASQHTGTAVIEMEKPAAGPPKPQPLAEARQPYKLSKSDVLAIARSPGPIADYDANLSKQINKRWRALVAKSSYPPRAGKVVVEFGLIIDGSVAGCLVTKNDVGEWGKLCREAIEQAAPFGPWPPEMRHLFGSNYRDIRFTFDYR